MPVIKSAKKKLRQDIKRTLRNKKLENLFQKAVKKAKKSPTETNIKEAVIIIDKTASRRIIHKNKAARIKSSLAKLLTAKIKPKKKESLFKKSSLKSKKK